MTVTRQVFADYDFIWVPTMSIGSGTQYHLAADLFTHPRLATLNFYPTIVAKLSKHVAALTPVSTTRYAVRDNHDPRREGTRAVYGFWMRASD